MSLAGNGANIYQNDHGKTKKTGCQPRFLKVYERRTRKRNIGTLSCGGNDIDMHQSGHGAPNRSGCQPQVLEVHMAGSNIRTTSLAGNEADICQNDQANTREFTPTFPIMCKKRRRPRRKALVFNFSYVQYSNKGFKVRKRGYRRGGPRRHPKITKVANQCLKFVKRRDGRGGAKGYLKIGKNANNQCFTASSTARRKSFSIDSGVKKIGCSSMTLRSKGNLKSHLVQEVLPTSFKIASPMADQETFECALGLSPMVKSQRKRSILPKRRSIAWTKFVCGEEKTSLEAVSVASTLPPIIPKRKRSKNGEKSTDILHSLYVNSCINRTNGNESFIDKSACCEIRECAQHEDPCPGTGGSTNFESLVESSAVLHSLYVNSCINRINWNESFIDKSACREIRECPQHEVPCPGTGGSTNFESLVESTASVHSCYVNSCINRINGNESFIDKSACCETRECPQHDDPCSGTGGSTNLESLVESLIEKLNNIRISRKQTRRRRGGISKKIRDNNTGQLVLWNPFGPIVIHKPLKRQKLPQVDIDMESLRVWKLLIENEGAIDEDLDKEKERWWEEQRNLFRGRVESFIARMRLVLGDRRFSQWKGSVVDSVVGVYLTQNVSDHLSSNAFMLLASAFPPQNKHEMTTQLGEDVITEGMKDSFETEECVNQKDSGFSVSPQSPMSICRSSTDELSFIDDRNISECLPTSYSLTTQVRDCIDERLHGTQEENTLRGENTCGSQVSGTSSTRIGDLGNEPVDLPGSTPEKKESEIPNEENTFLDENTCGSQVSVTSSTRSGDLGNEPVDLPEWMPEKKDDKNISECLPTSYSCTTQVRDCIDERPHGTQAENTSHAENTCGSQVSGTSSTSSGDLGNEPVYLPESTPEKKESEIPNEENTFRDENTCGSQVSVISSTRSGDLGNEPVHLPESMPENKDEPSEIPKQEKTFCAENTCGSQVSVTSSTRSGDLGNEPIYLPESVPEKKNEPSEIPKQEIDWDELRRTYSTGRSSGDTERNRDSVNWDAVRQADVEKIVEPIKCRGQSNILAAKIKNFLNRLVKDHGSTDLEWLRVVPHEKVKEFLFSIHGIGPKSVDCLRLLTLRHVAFPVDINVARVAVRLGWVPLQPLPDGVQMHLLERYPMESSIQKYLWPRLCKLDLLTLYELHYHMITFGKVFCTKRSPNCNACPLRADCRHFASAFASARLRLSGPQQKGVVSSEQPVRVGEIPNMHVPSPALPLPSRSFPESRSQTQSCEPIIEMPASPEYEPVESLERDIEDFPYETEHEQEIPTIQFNTEEFRENVLDFIKNSNTKEFQGNVSNFVNEINLLHREEEVSKVLTLLSPEAASFPARKLKSESRLRTEHLVYELPDYHPLLSGFEVREPDDPCPYLLAICQTEEYTKNKKNLGKESGSMESDQCKAEMCSGSANCNPNDQFVYGTILIPCRTANRGSFPLNGTYFQVNEVFADHESSQHLIRVPRVSIWHLRRRPLLCGTSVKAIFKGMSTADIQYCFWRGYVCVRGYDRKQRAPRPLHNRFHSGPKIKDVEE